MVNALLFPGQGSQEVGMGKEIYEQLPQARSILDEACDMVGYNLRNLMFNGPIEELTDTKYAQPAIYTCSAMYLEKIKADHMGYDYVAGHSLGEYSALYAAGVFSFSEGLKLVCKRGQAMSAENGKGVMDAVLGLKEDELREYLEMTSDVVIANLNSQVQIVISGKESGINIVEADLAGKENVKIKRLRVSAAFHSPQMNAAAQIMESYIEGTLFREPSCYVVSNVTGKPTRNLSEIKSNLIAQITGQVRWYDTILAMKAANVSMFYEVGCGDVLKKLNKTITFRPRCLGVNIRGNNGDI